MCISVGRYTLCDLFLLSVSGDPISMDLERQREWDEAVRLHVYNLESELLLHGR